MKFINLIAVFTMQISFFQKGRNIYTEWPNEVPEKGEFKNLFKIYIRRFFWFANYLHSAHLQVHSYQYKKLGCFYLRLQERKPPASKYFY